ncbi:MAG: hypothetical protein AB7P69_24175 [Candidatus Binatia bacterium]
MTHSALAEVLPLAHIAYTSDKTDNSMPSWSEEALTPEQFFPPAMDSVVAWSGERKLLLAVLQDAVGSFFRYRKDPTTRGRRLFREIHEWFWSTDRQWLCSFESICDNLHLDANYIRRGLKLYYDPVAFSATPPPVQRRRTRRANSHLTIVRNGMTQQDGDREKCA